MTKAEMTEQELAELGVRVVRCPWLHRKALATADGYVALGQTADSGELHTVLAHEKQHFRLRAFYPAEADAATRRRSEAQVHRALIEEVCPAETLAELLRQNRTVSEIAEQLEITEELVVAAYAFYRERDPHAFGG